MPLLSGMAVAFDGAEGFTLRDRPDPLALWEPARAATLSE